MDALEKKVADSAKEKRFVKLRMVADEERKREMIEIEGQKEKLEEEIEEVEEKIKKKKEELERLQAEVKVLESEILEGVVVMEKGGLKKRERVKAEKKCNVVLLHCGCLSLIPFNPFIEFMNLEFGTTHQVQMC